MVVHILNNDLSKKFRRRMGVFCIITGVYYISNELDKCRMNARMAELEKKLKSVEGDGNECNG